jgi:sugar lactone lactonase YvrE
MRLRTVLATIAVSLLHPIAPAHAAEIETLVSFDLGAGELPEGVAVDHRGNIFVSLTAPVSEIRKVAPSGAQTTLVDLGLGGFGPLGLAMDAQGNVYVAAASFEPATQDVYRVTPDGTATRLPDTGAIAFPNGIAFDQRGNIFVSLTAPVSEIRTDLGTLVSIPVRPDGSAGEASVIVEDPAILGIDGLTVDAHGTIYACVIVQSTVVRIQGDDVVTLADADDGSPARRASRSARGRATTGACTA